MTLSPALETIGYTGQRVTNTSRRGSNFRDSEVLSKFLTEGSPFLKGIFVVDAIFELTTNDPGVSTTPLVKAPTAYPN